MVNDSQDQISLNELQWAHQCVVRMIQIVNRHAYLDQRRDSAIHHLTKGILWLESIIQEQTRMARRRSTDGRGGAPIEGASPLPAEAQDSENPEPGAA